MSPLRGTFVCDAIFPLNIPQNLVKRNIKTDMRQSWLAAPVCIKSSHGVVEKQQNGRLCVPPEKKQSNFRPFLPPAALQLSQHSFHLIGAPKLNLHWPRPTIENPGGKRKEKLFCAVLEIGPHTGIGGSCQPVMGSQLLANKKISGSASACWWLAGEWHASR